MHLHQDNPPGSPPTPASRPPGGTVGAYLRLARPSQWLKSAFVFVGPAYHVSQHVDQPAGRMLLSTAAAAASFALASSACYVFNDLADAEADRAHPRKRHRPIASGLIAPGPARVYGFALFLAALIPLALLDPAVVGWVGAAVALYVANVTAYSAVLKHRPIVDVISLSLGFVLRVIGGCAAVAIVPTSWLLNVTFFLSMFLAFGKRLGERRTTGSAAASARAVQERYSDELLRMVVVVTAVATLLSYAGYVQSRDDAYRIVTDHGPIAGFGFNLLWVSVLPTTYGLVRSILLLEHGKYDDPTELVIRDRPTLLAAASFGLVTSVALWIGEPSPAGPELADPAPSSENG